MHLSLILLTIGLAILIRLVWARQETAWVKRWQTALATFLLPPLLLLMTSVAVLCMGTQGQMLGLQVGWLGYSLALGFVGFAGVSLLWLFWQGWRSLQQVRTYDILDLIDQTGYLLDSPTLFAAQIGFWQSKLLVSRGLLQNLTPAQLDAVLTHEQAHHHYRDTFWFFGLGWLRHLTTWLPNTEALWQELLLLRELRADQWAAQRVDPLLLAEALLLVVKAPMTDSNNNCVAFSAALPVNRLEERISSLLTPSAEIEQSKIYQWVWLFLSLFPLLSLTLHV
ncbi:MAG: M56 family metallopeptidase [Leptolyngbyaceae cyanobacterium SM1_4_3]|nr:M56 family metallopeptidase [Leptolyngbyaceae cyanobacterium SM1_4_3]NJN89417.1 M56 family metallopeptidase [Leptolyngbyaceae cyanobacterium SL_5_14]